MLQNIRDRFTGGFALAILALICVPFLFFGINYDFIGSSYAAKVNGEEVSLAAFDNAYRQQLAQYAEAGTELPDQFRNALKEGVLNRLIGETLVDQYLTSEGYRISDAMVMSVIQRQPEFHVDGKFSKDNYYAWLAERGQTPASFEQFQRYQLRQSQLQRGVAATAFVTPADYRRFLNLFAEEREVSIATFDLDAVAETIEVSDEQIQNYYDERPNEFRSEESVDLKFIELQRADLQQQANVSEEDVRQYYEESRGRFLQDEQRRASHILIPFGDDEAAARERAGALAERARAGEPFADLARQYSEDGGTAEQGGDLGLLSESQYYPDELGDVVFAMQKGEVSEPVRTEFGFHVVRLDEIVAGGPLPFEQVRAELERELRERAAADAWTKLTDKVSDALFDADDIDAMGSQLGLKVQSASGFTRSGGAGFGSNQAAIDAVFEPSVLNEGRISDIIELDADRAVVVQVTEHNEATRLPLQDVREGIVSAIRSERASEIISERSNELQAAVREGGEFEVAAQEVAASEIRTLAIGRQERDADSNVRSAVFQLPKPDGDTTRVGSVRTNSGDIAVFQLLSVTPGRPESIPIAERDEGKSNLAAQAGNADYAALVLELERRADVVRNREALAQETLF